MLIYSILIGNKKELKFLAKSDENVELAMRTLKEFKKHGISVEDLKKEVEKTSDNYLKTKLKDIEIIYENFENKIADSFIEDTDILTLLSKNLEKTNMIKDSIIYIDEFAGFTHQEYEVLKVLIKQAKQVSITSCIDNLNFNTNPDTDIFYSNKLTISKILKLVEDNNLKLEEPVNLKELHRFKTKELKHLEQNIYSTKITKYEENVENIQIFLAKNGYSEIEHVAKEITKLVRDKNLRYKDISVITKNTENYASLARSIFDKYDIPVFIDEKRDLNQNIFIQYILSILEILSKNFSNESVFGYIKTGFLKLEKDEVFKLENYCTKWGIKQNKWKKDFVYELNDENKKQEVENLNEIRKQIVEPILELKLSIQNDKTAKTITKEIYMFMQAQEIEEKLKEKIHKLEEKEKIDLANEYKASYKIVIDLFDEIVEIFNEDKMTIDKYIQILKTGLKNSGLGRIPGTADQVIIGDIDRSRSHKVNTIFIIGLNDGSFPSSNKDEGFFNDKDRENLKEDGLELAFGTIEQLYEENFNIYKAFTTAEGKIFLSYCSQDSESKTLRPSILITKIKKMFPKIQEQSDVVNKQYEILNKTVTYDELIENIAKTREGKQIEEIWYAVYKYYKTQNEWKSKLENNIQGLYYTNLPENINEESINKLYGNTLNTSVSRLEKYRSCPFSYYLQYGLKLKEKEELKIQSFNTGSFMHEAIDEFFEYVRQENIILSKLVSEPEDIRKSFIEGYNEDFLVTEGKCNGPCVIEKIVNKIINEKLNLSKNFIFTATAKYKVLVKRLKKIISKAILYIIEGLVYSEFDILGTELEFGNRKDYEPITLNLDNGKRVEITGKIDRIDLAKTDNGNYLRIIDYKSSAKNIDLNEVYAGLQIQLLTYMDAVCKKEDLMPAGILYFSLLEQMVKADKKITEEQIEDEIRKHFKMKGLIVAEVKIIGMHDKNLKSGSSKLVPAAITSSGTVNEKWTNGVKQEEFKVLQEYIYKTIKQISKEILSGRIELKPYNKKGNSPCKYCTYKAICGFNSKNCNNTYNYIDQKSKDEILSKMEKEIGG